MLYNPLPICQQLTKGQNYDDFLFSNCNNDLIIVAMW
jgi:hypothetical protein